MYDPLSALIAGILILAGAAVLFWPSTGFISRWKRGSKTNDRILIEDSLKHLFDYETRNINATINSLAGNLSVSGSEAAKIAEKLEEMELIDSRNNRLNLTNEGRSYALRILRIHRLWEKYLADQTGVKALEWHSEAEKVEHEMSDEEADKLAAQIGNPLKDPHGDPIPTRSGEVREVSGVSLGTLKPGESGIIVHIEDEPHHIYEQLVAEGLHKGMPVRMIETDRKRLKFIAEGEECILAPVFAGNVTIKKTEQDEESFEKYDNLTSLTKGELAEVIGISKACRGLQRRRLMDLGVVPGTKITIELEGSGRDPIGYNIRNSVIALRNSQAKYIFIKKVNESELIYA